MPPKAQRPLNGLHELLRILITGGGALRTVRGDLIPTAASEVKEAT
jgi:hypothetical protein